MLEKVKLALRITTNLFDQELTDLILSACQDLQIAGVEVEDDLNALASAPVIVQRAVVTYVKVNFGSNEDAERLKTSYDEQKAQLRTATGFTIWG